MGNMVKLKEENLKQGVMGLVIALVEIIKEALEIQAIRRMESNELTEEETEKLGEALMDLDEAIDSVKMEIGIIESVKAVRDGLDRVVDEVVNSILNPWNDGRTEERKIGTMEWWNDGTMERREN